MARAASPAESGATEQEHVEANRQEGDADSFETTTVARKHPCLELPGVATLLPRPLPNRSTQQRPC